jgi:hypothetical protein
VQFVGRSHACWVVAFLFLASCGNDSSPTPTAVATPSPSPTPTPTPTPQPSPSALGCKLEPQDDCGRSGCCEEDDETTIFEAEIERAQEALKLEHEDWFNDDGSLDVEAEEYTAALAKKITDMTGLCARGGGGRTSISRDEVAVKRDNNMSQNVDVIVGNKGWPAVAGVYTCRPASF